jgi:uncharacterized RDD family membrane protein YckC
MPTVDGRGDEQWYVAIDGVTSGPFSTSAVQSMAIQGALRDDCAVVPVGAQEWVAVSLAATRLGLQRDQWGRYTATGTASSTHLAPVTPVPGGPLPPPVPGWSPAPAHASSWAGQGGAIHFGVTQERAAYGRRAAAWIIDLLLQAFMVAPLLPLLGVEVDGDLGQLPELPSSAVVVVLAVSLVYATLFHGAARGQTPGKMLLRIRVVAVDGQRLGYGRAFLRTATAVLLLNLLTIPGIVDMLWPLWDAQRQTLHDKAARSIVIPAGG